MGNILAGELYKFGLNHEDWHIEKDLSSDNQYVLVNRLDPDFQMRGSVDFSSEQSAHWNEISIAD